MLAKERRVEHGFMLRKREETEYGEKEKKWTWKKKMKSGIKN